MHQDAWIILDSPENMKNAFRMSLLNLYVNSSYGNPRRTNQVIVKQMRWNGLPWSEERWHCYSGTDRRWRSTHGYGWQMTENSLRWFFRHDDAAGKWRVEFTLHKKIVGRTTRQTTPTGATRFVYLQAASSVWFKHSWIWRKVTLVLLSSTVTAWYLDGRVAKHARLLIM